MKRTPLKRKTPLRANVRVVRAGTTGPDLTRKPRPVKQRPFGSFNSKLTKAIREGVVRPGDMPDTGKPRVWVPVAKQSHKKAVVMRAPLRKLGKKGKAWNEARRKLKDAFLAAGITSCELRAAIRRTIPAARLDCWRDNGLGFAHTHKRRNITTPEGLLEVALSCNNCHDFVEGLKENEMAAIIRNAIARRQTPVVLAP